MHILTLRVTLSQAHHQYALLYCSMLFYAQVCFILSCSVQFSSPPLYKPLPSSLFSIYTSGYVVCFDNLQFAQSSHRQYRYRTVALPLSCVSFTLTPDNVVISFLLVFLCFLFGLPYLVHCGHILVLSEYAVTRTVPLSV